MLIERIFHSTTYEKKAPLIGAFGGDGEIRTLDTGLSPYASLAGKCLRPLGHVSTCNP